MIFDLLSEISCDCQTQLEEIKNNIKRKMIASNRVIYTISSGKRMVKN